MSLIPDSLHRLFEGAVVFDSSCSPQANVLFIDKDNGYFLKTAKKNTLKKEAELWKYFHTIGLSSKMLEYISDDCDYLLTEKVDGSDCTERCFLEKPELLCDRLAYFARMLHEKDPSDCPLKNRLYEYDKTVMENYKSRSYDRSAFPDSFGYKDEKQAITAYLSGKELLKSDVLIHGDLCLPNIILGKDLSFSGFIDMGNGGIGDRHIDIFWCVWSLFFNLRTDKYTERFFDAYGRELINKDALRTVAAAEVFG